MSDWTPTSLLAHLVDLAGFRYLPEQDIIYTRRDALQRQFGYAFRYDQSVSLISADIDCEPIFFDYGGKHWMIELWKGQYGLETGCEIGVYNRPITNPPWYYPILDGAIGVRPADPAHGYYYACASDAEMLLMASRLRTTGGDELFHRGPEQHWWLTGFKWGVDSDPDDLELDVDITLLDAAMTAAFVNALQSMGYTPQVDGLRVQFTFARPKTSYQPRLANPALRAAVLAANAEIVATYRAAGLPNNDPNQIPGALAVKIESMVGRRSADALGQLLTGTLRSGGQSADAAVRLIGSGLAVAVADFEAWVTSAGYSVAEWFESIGAFLAGLFSFDDSCIVEIVNVDHGGRPPTTLRLVDSTSEKHSSWAIKPPQVIRPRQRYRFFLKDAKGVGSSGSKGSATYAYLDQDGSERRVAFSFTCPFMAFHDNKASSSDPNFRTYAKTSGTGSWKDRVPTGGHPLYVAYVWDQGPAPS